jgi:hypothetical protein
MQPLGVGVKKIKQSFDIWKLLGLPMVVNQALTLNFQDPDGLALLSNQSPKAFTRVQIYDGGNGA